MQICLNVDTSCQLPVLNVIQNLIVDCVCLWKGTCQKMGVSERRFNSEWNREQTHHWNGKFIPPMHLHIFHLSCGAFRSTPTPTQVLNLVLSWFLTSHRRISGVGHNIIWVWAYWLNIPTVISQFVVKEVAYFHVKSGTTSHKCVGVGLQGVTYVWQNC